jgi:hypothetical protein
MGHKCVGAVDETIQQLYGCNKCNDEKTKTIEMSGSDTAMMNCEHVML